MSSYLNAIKWSESITSVFYYNTIEKLKTLSIRKLRSIAQFINQHVERYFVKSVLGKSVSKFNKKDLINIIFNYMNKENKPEIVLDDYNVIIKHYDTHHELTYDSPDENTVKKIGEHILNKYSYVQVNNLFTSDNDCHTLILKYNNLQTLINIANDIIRGRKKSKVIDDLGVYLSKNGLFYIEFKGENAKARSENLKNYIVSKNLTNKPVYLIERCKKFYVLGMRLTKEVCHSIVNKRRKKLKKFSE